MSAAAHSGRPVVRLTTSTGNAFQPRKTPFGISVTPPAESEDRKEIKQKKNRFDGRGFDVSDGLMDQAARWRSGQTIDFGCAIGTPSSSFTTRR